MGSTVWLRPGHAALRLAVTAIVALTCATGASGAAAEPPPGIAYTTLFQDPGPGADFSLENHAIGLIDATPEGASITFAFRDYNRETITDALIRAGSAGGPRSSGWSGRSAPITSSSAGRRTSCSTRASRTRWCPASSTTSS
jgi:hypothetical protein